MAGDDDDGGMSFMSFFCGAQIVHNVYRWCNHHRHNSLKKYFSNFKRTAKAKRTFYSVHTTHNSFHVVRFPFKICTAVLIQMHSPLP